MRNKRIDEVMYKSTISWYADMKRINKNRIVKRVFESELIDVRGVDRPRKRWSNSLKEILRYNGVVIEQTKKIVYDRRHSRVL